MTWLLIVGGAVAVVAFLAVIHGRSKKREGEAVERFRQEERAKDEAWRAKAARERLEHDDAERQRVRKKYTRLL